MSTEAIISIASRYLVLCIRMYYFKLLYSTRATMPGEVAVCLRERKFELACLRWYIKMVGPSSHAGLRPLLLEQYLQSH